MMKPIIKEDDIVVLPGDEFDQAQDQMNRKTNLVTVILFSIFLSAGVLSYVLSSVYNEEFWSSLWVLLLVGPIVASFYRALVKYKMNSFCYPLVVIAIYFSVAKIYSLWHPLWVIFLTIPVYYAVGELVDRIKRKVKKA